MRLSRNYPMNRVTTNYTESINWIAQPFVVTAFMRLVPQLPDESGHYKLHRINQLDRTNVRSDRIYAVVHNYPMNRVTTNESPTTPPAN